jgi:hypothetical protein
MTAVGGQVAEDGQSLRGEDEAGGPASRHEPVHNLPRLDHSRHL